MPCCKADCAFSARLFLSCYFRLCTRITHGRSTHTGMPFSFSVCCLCISSLQLMQPPSVLFSRLHHGPCFRRLLLSSANPLILGAVACAGCLPRLILSLHLLLWFSRVSEGPARPAVSSVSTGQPQHTAPHSPGRAPAQGIVSFLRHAPGLYICGDTEPFSAVPEVRFQLQGVGGQEPRYTQVWILEEPQHSSIKFWELWEGQQINPTEPECGTLQPQG